MSIHEDTGIKLEVEAELCRCCHAEGSFKNLYSTYYWMDGEPVVYANMLRESFNIELLGVKSGMQQTLNSICYSCIQRLEDAVKFKRQVQQRETRFQSVYVNYICCDPIYYEVKIKQDPDPAESSNVVNNVDTGPDTVAKAEDHAWDDDCKDADYTPTLQIVPLKVRKKGQKHKLKQEKQKANKLKRKTNKHGTDNLGTDTQDMDCSHCSTQNILKNYKPGPGKKVPMLPIYGPEGEEETRSRKELVPPHYQSESDEEIIYMPRIIIKRDIDFKKIENGFQCLKCPTIEKDARKIRIHIKTVHLNIPKHSCPICNEAFSSLSVFIRHKLDEHNIDDRFKCNACERAFNAKKQLQKHINTFHMLGEKIKCKECDYETFSTESLNKHKYKHKTVKDYQCQYCKKAFLRKATLQLHERIHTGDRRKVCAVCGQAFVQKASLNYHMAKYHPEVAF